MRTEAAPPARGPGLDFETVIMRFEAAWESGTVPDLVSFVPPDAPMSVLVEIVLIDMERRFKIGGPVNVERYLAAFPALADDIDAMAALIETECRFRRRFGPPPETGEYARRFPNLGTVVQRLERATVSMGASPAGSSYAFPTSAHLDPAEGPGEIGRLGRYRVTRVLGKGGMGVVYAAEDPSLKRMVALKLIRPEYDVELSAGLVARFRAEAEAVAAVRHANVVQVYEVGEHSGRPYIALEYIDGGSLEAKVAVAPLPPRAAAELLVPVARAVHVAHERNIIHRDLKPANILLTAAGEPKVTDFGLAKRLDQGGGLTQTGAVMGTPYYMAPEQARGDQKGVGTAADVWALGAILYRVLGGRPPFQAATAALTYQQILHADSVPLRRLVPGLPRDLETACAACLHKDPAKRYSSAADFADDLDRYLTGRPILARPLGLAGRADRWGSGTPALPRWPGLSPSSSSRG